MPVHHLQLYDSPMIVPSLPRSMLHCNSQPDYAAERPRRAVDTRLWPVRPYSATEALVTETGVASIARVNEIVQFPGGVAHGCK